MGDSFEDWLPAIGAAIVLAVDIALTGGFSGIGAATIAGVVAADVAAGYSIGFIAQSFVVGSVGSPIFDPGGIGGSTGPRGTVSGGKSFASSGDGGFDLANTSPQSPVPIVLGTYMLPGTLLDIYPLGEDNKRAFYVVGIAKAPVTKVTTLIDGTDITTIPGFVDVDTGGEPDDSSTWMKFVGTGGSSGDIILSNSGKKHFNTRVAPRERGVTPDVYFFNVQDGYNEARIFLSVEVPGIYLDYLDTVNADYSGISTKTLIIKYMKDGDTDTTIETVTFTNALQSDTADYTSLGGLTLITTIDGVDYTVTFTNALLSSSADYTGLDGLTLIINVSGTDRTVTFTAGAVDQATTLAEINGQIGTYITAVAVDAVEFRIDHDGSGLLSVTGGTATGKFNLSSVDLDGGHDETTVIADINAQIGAYVTASVVGSDFRIDNDGSGLLEDGGGTGSAQLNLESIGTTHSAATVVSDINDQTTAITASVINVDEVRIQSNFEDNRRLELSGTAFAQLGISSKNFGTTISYGLSMQERDDDITTTIVTDSNVEMEYIANNLPRKTTLLVQYDGNYYIDASIPNAGFYSFILELTQATNGANAFIAIVEVMSDFIKTVDGNFSGIADQTLVFEINDGSQPSVTFDSVTNTAALAADDINTQLETYVTATVDSDGELLVEAIATPVGTDSIAEVKQVKIIGGTAAEDLNFQSIYSETKSYDYDEAYAIINILKTDRISSNPKFKFEVTGGPSNPAQNLKDLFCGSGSYFGKGLNLGSKVDGYYFDNSIDFDSDEGLECNMAILDSTSGEIITALLNAGSLLRDSAGGRYRILPETNSQVAAEFYVTDDFSKDNIVKDSWSWSLIDETQKFNVLRVTYPDADNEYISRDIVIDVTGEVDTENGVEPQIYENGVLINISDSEFDFERVTTRNFPAVTSRAQALRLGRQIFKKQQLGNIVFNFDVSIRDTFVKKFDIVRVFIDDLGFNGKLFRILAIQESDNYGYKLTTTEYFPGMYN